MLRCRALQAGKSVDVPMYDFSRHARSEQTQKVQTAAYWSASAALVMPCTRCAAQIVDNVFDGHHINADGLFMVMCGDIVPWGM